MKVEGMLKDGGLMKDGGNWKSWETQDVLKDGWWVKGGIYNMTPYLVS